LFYLSAVPTDCILLVRLALALSANSLPSVYTYKLRDLDFAKIMFPGSDSQRVIGISHTLLVALKPGNAL